MAETVISLADSRIKQMSYVLFSGKRVDPARATWHDSAYNLWRKTWQQTFEELKSEAKVKADDFTRHDVVGALFYQDRAVGMLLHSFCDLRLAAVRDHSYLSTFPAGIISQLRESGVTDAISMEYLTLDPEWRKSLIDVPVAKIILGLGARIVEASGMTGIAVTRNAKKVNDILYEFGASCLAPGLTKHNVAVDLVSFDPEKVDLTKDAAVETWVRYFWDRRVNDVQIPRKRAASVAA